ncbi:hypothetical protein HER10_EVM0012797 [Colletotrichum scovillei]|uniref:Uncharacterized protein n=1 Tax=Colletotrichum scovillei TaxID=1209932 RepID=A0A9P7R6P4_9PEZI|nr:uncharacterized protein HER10_EVM0012797 [Colletotrichum scovillei]KAF4774419.1 hypothetical protein HER10_EVM0012797 [Colletotrichum scovillei]KAG7048754.1 hypothetical protein JMJ77_0014387 [Colletotrichum scovillei]KAG7065915.1 hypothetical protein JMJ78_0012658 [Colletotrichum scovillei]KAG7068519.1 hypothetical protein JMJ76_0008205 [Colletotrichum scovillei]
MASQFETMAKLRSVTSSPFPPESDALRGRKRHRSLTRCDLEATHYGGTGESSTLRGRPRRRSTSPTPVSSRASSRAGAGAGGGGMTSTTDVSPMRKRLLRVVLLERRRSQSPSRSRSPDRKQAPPRRRHRTRSRSRTHHTKDLFQPKDQLPRLLLGEQAHKKVDTSVQA